MKTGASRVRAAVLYARYTDLFSYYDDWRDAFLAHPAFDAVPFNACDRGEVRRFRRTAGEYDLVVLLHSMTADSLRHARRCREALGNRRGKLLVFVGNEVNLPESPLGEKIRLIREVGADFVGTQLPLPAGEWLYAGLPRTKVVALPHALNPGAFRPDVPPAKRPVDIGVRSHRYLPFLGDDERNRIIDGFATRSFDPPLAVDIDTEGRLSREGWARFLNRCKGTVSTEAGSYYLERDDRTVQAIRLRIEERQRESGGRVLRSGSAAERAALLLPRPVRRLLRGLAERAGVRQEFRVQKEADFGEIFGEFFAGREKCPRYSKAISSRHFDAIGAKTCQIMFRGPFNGILRADEHYIALERDFGNVDDALRAFRDEGVRTAMVDRTYEYVREEHTYRNRLADVLRLLEGA